MIVSFVQFVLTLLLPKLWYLFLILRLVIPKDINFIVDIILGFGTAIIAIILSNEYIYPPSSEDFSSPLTITLGVPCIPPDINKLTDLVKNANEQTRLPDEMVVSLSESTNKQGQKLEKNLNTIANFPVKIIVTQNKAYAGPNRNTVARNAKSEYISYIDADDTMHPDRLQLIEHYLKEFNKPMGLVHGFFYGRNKRRLKEFEVWDPKKLYNHHMSNKKELPIPDISLHHGHPTFAKRLFEKIKYTSRPRGQDAEMIRNVLDLLGETDDGLVYIGAPLTYYVKRPLGLTN